MLRRGLRALDNVIRYSRLPSHTAQTDVNTPKLDPKPLSTIIKDAFLHPLPSRYGGPLRVVRFVTGGFLAYHIFTHYFFECSMGYGISMLPTIRTTGDWLLISKYYRRGRGVEVGDMVSFKHPVASDGTMGVKRVVGMSGDFVLSGTPGQHQMMIQVSYVVTTYDRDIQCLLACQRCY